MTNALWQMGKKQCSHPRFRQLASGNWRNEDRRANHSAQYSDKKHSSYALRNWMQPRVALNSRGIGDGSLLMLSLRVRDLICFSDFGKSVASAKAEPPNRILHRGGTDGVAR